MKTLGYIEEIRKKFTKIEGKPVSDYRVAQLLETSKQAVSRYVNHGSTFDDETAAKAGALLDMPTYIVIADMCSERARKKGNKEVIHAWEEITKKLTGTAAGVLLTVAATLPNKADAEQFNISKITPSNSSIIYIMPFLKRCFNALYEFTLTHILFKSTYTESI